MKFISHSKLPLHPKFTTGTHNTCSFLIFYLFICVCVYACSCVLAWVCVCVSSCSPCGSPWRVKKSEEEGVVYSGTGVAGICKLPCRCWKLNPHPLPKLQDSSLLTQLSSPSGLYLLTITSHNQIFSRSAQCPLTLTLFAKWCSMLIVQVQG